MRHLRRPRLLIVAPIALALAVAGCGNVPTKQATTFTGESASVAEVITSFQSAAQSRDSGKLCDQILAPTLVAKLKDSGGGCKHVIGNQVNTIGDYSLTVESIQVSGNNAQARVKSISNGKTHYDTLLLTKIGSSWKISGLA